MSDTDNEYMDAIKKIIAKQVDKIKKEVLESGGLLLGEPIERFYNNPDAILLAAVLMEKNKGMKEAKALFEIFNEFEKARKDDRVYTR